MVISAVVMRLIAEHIEEETIHIVSLKDFLQNLEGVLAVVSPVDAG